MELLTSLFLHLDAGRLDAGRLTDRFSEQLAPLLRLLPSGPSRQALAALVMQQWAAAAACAASLLLVLASIAAGWIALWHTTLKDVGFFREIMGLNKPRPDVKAQRQASINAEIEKIKRQHSRSRSITRQQGAPRAATQLQSSAQ